MTTYLDPETLYHRLNATPEQIEAFCCRWHITELALFGSILRDDFDPQNSDVDVLATFDPAQHRGLREAMQMQDELKALCSRSVDIISRSSLEQSSNWITKNNILSSIQVIYVRTP